MRTNGQARAWSLGVPARLAFPAIGLALSVASVAILVRLVNPAQIGAALGAADFRYIGLLALMMLASYPLRSYRWSLLLKPVATLRQSDVLSATAVGLLGNTLLPARAGDVGRGLLIGRKSGISAVTTLTTVAGERLLDVAANLLIAAVLALVVGIPRFAELWAAHARTLGVIALAIAVGLPASGLLWRLFIRRPPQWLRHGRIKDFLTSLAAGFQVFSDPRALANAAAWSLALWLLLGTTNYFGMLALGLRLPLHVAFVVMLAQTVGVAIPSSPAYVGTFHVATVLTLSLYDIPPAASVPFAVIVHATGVIVSVVVGVPFLFYEGLGARELWRVVSRSASSVS